MSEGDLHRRIPRGLSALAADHNHLAPPHSVGLDLRPPDANGTLKANPGRWKAVGTTVSVERTVAVGPLHVPGDGDCPVVGQLTRNGSRSRQALDAGLANLRMRATPLEQQEPDTESSDRKNNEAPTAAQHGARVHNSPSPKGSAAMARDPAPHPIARRSTRTHMPPITRAAAVRSRCRDRGGSASSRIQ